MKKYKVVVSAQFINGFKKITADVEAESILEAMRKAILEFIKEWDEKDWIDIPKNVNALRAVCEIVGIYIEDPVEVV